MNLARAVFCVLLLVHCTNSQTVDKGKEPAQDTSTSPGSMGDNSGGDGKKKGLGGEIGGAEKRDDWRKEISDAKKTDGGGGGGGGGKHKSVVNEADAARKAQEVDPRRLRQFEPRKSRRAERLPRYDWRMREPRPRPRLRMIP